MCLRFVSSGNNFTKKRRTEQRGTVTSETTTTTRRKRDMLEPRWRPVQVETSLHPCNFTSSVFTALLIDTRFTVCLTCLTCLLAHLPACLSMMPRRIAVASLRLFLSHPLSLSLSLLLRLNLRLFVSRHSLPLASFTVLCVALLLNDDRHVPCSPFARCRYQTLLFSFFPIICHLSLPSFIGVRAAFVSPSSPSRSLFRIVSFCHDRIYRLRGG